MAIGGRGQELQDVLWQFQKIDLERGEDSCQSFSLLFAVNNSKWRLSVSADGIAVISTADTLGR